MKHPDIWLVDMVSNEEKIGPVCYEIKMFRRTVARLSDGSIDSQPPDIRNAVIESFAIHTRVLLYFFYKRKTRDDIVARDFVDTWSSPAITGTLKYAGHKANKQLAHLTEARILEFSGKSKKEWKYPAISKDMEYVITSFLDAVPTETKEIFVENLLRV